MDYRALRVDRKFPGGGIATQGGCEARGIGHGKGKGEVVELAHGIVQGWCWDARVMLTVTVGLERFDSAMRWGTC